MQVLVWRLSLVPRFRGQMFRHFVYIASNTTKQFAKGERIYSENVIVAA